MSSDLCVQCVSGHRADEAVKMLKTFYKQENPNGTRTFFYHLFWYFCLLIFISCFSAPKPKIRKD